MSVQAPDCFRKTSDASDGWLRIRLALTSKPFELYLSCSSAKPVYCFVKPVMTLQMPHVNGLI